MQDNFFDSINPVLVFVAQIGILGVVWKYAADKKKTREDRKYNYRIKVDFLLNHIEQAIIQAEYQVNSVEQFLKDFEEDIQSIPEVRFIAYDALDILSKSITQEDYYTAVRNIFKKAIESELDENYRMLQHSTFYLVKSFARFGNEVTLANESDRKEKDKLVDAIADIFKYIHYNFSHADNDENREVKDVLNELLEKIHGIVDNYNDIENLSLQDLDTRILRPLNCILDEYNVGPELEYLVNEASDKYETVLDQNKENYHIFKEYLEGFIYNKDKLNEVYTYLNNSQLYY